MGREYCCVPMCKSDARFDSGKGKTFHRFPSDPKRKEAWIIKIRSDEGPLFQVCTYFIHPSALFLSYSYIIIQNLLHRF